MSVLIKGTIDMWEDFCDTNRDIAMKRAEYVKIAVGFNLFIAQKVLEGYDVYLPNGLGYLGIRGMHNNPQIDAKGEIKGLPVDWGETKKLWRFDPVAKAKKKFIYNFNEHTNGVIYTIHWHKENVEIPNRSIYSFRISRDIRAKMAAAIQAGMEYAEKLIPSKQRKYAKQITTEATEGNQAEVSQQEDLW